MPAISTGAERKQRLRPLDPSLPLLAAEAALELDEVRLGKLDVSQAAAQLAEMLQNSFRRSSGQPEERYLIDPGALTVLTDAVTRCRAGQEEKDLPALVEEAWYISRGLTNAAGGNQRDQIEELRDFCVALSRCAGAYVETVRGSSPRPAYRR
jgi:hypothetical protein